MKYNTLFIRLLLRSFKEYSLNYHCFNTHLLQVIYRFSKLPYYKQHEEASYLFFHLKTNYRYFFNMFLTVYNCFLLQEAMNTLISNNALKLFVENVIESHPKGYNDYYKKFYNNEFRGEDFFIYAFNWFQCKHKTSDYWHNLHRLFRQNAYKCLFIIDSKTSIYG